jgi:peptidyl-tRNA hydrolase, PTH1 family
MVVDEFARRLGIDRWKVKDGARQAYDSARGLVLVQPQTFMNNSGVPIRLIASWYKVPPEDLLVVYDEMDIPFGKLRLRAFGGHGGHNGMRSIIATMGEQFARLRIGVGRPEYDSIDHVLAPFNAEERAALPDIISAATDGVTCWFERGIEAAMQFANTWEVQPEG